MSGKKSMSALVLSVVAAVLIVPLSAVQAQNTVNHSDGIAKKATFGSEVVSILNDGRIKGIESPEKLSVQDRHKILKLLNFTDADIALYPDDLEYDLLRDGGRQVKTNVSNYQHVVTHEDGTTEVINDSLEGSTPAVDGEIGTLGMGGETSGIFSGKGVLTYLGTTTSEYKYKYRTTFNWSTKPNLTYVDDIGISWNATSVPVGTIAYDYRRLVPPGAYFSETSRMNASQDLVAGVAAEIDLQNEEGSHYGYLEREVRISKTRVNETEVFGSAYGHSHLPSGIGGIGITIGWASITLSGTGDKWTWVNDFKVGATS